MKAAEIVKAFSRRKIINWKAESFNFEDLACTVTSLREEDMLNIIPALMIFILEKGGESSEIRFAEMVVFSLMPRPTGWSNLIDHMNRKEISATLEWLRYIRGYNFIENCDEELQLATELFNDRETGAV